MKKLYAGIAASLLAVGVLAVTGCGGAEKKAPKEQKAAVKPATNLTVYTSVYNGMVKEMAKPVVEQQLKEIKVDGHTEGSEKVKERIAGELAGGKAKADIVMISDPGFYVQMKKDGNC